MFFFSTSLPYFHSKEVCLANINKYHILFTKHFFFQEKRGVMSNCRCFSIYVKAEKSRLTCYDSQGTYSDFYFIFFFSVSRFDAMKQDSKTGC